MFNARLECVGTPPKHLALPTALPVRHRGTRKPVCGQLSAPASWNAQRLRSRVVLLHVISSSGLGSSESGLVNMAQAEGTVDNPLTEDSAPQLRLELEGLRLKDLRARAKAASMSAEQLEEAMDSDEPEEALISFLVQVAAA